MKNRLGWPLAALAVLTFSFGQATATASQALPSNGASVTVPQVAPAAVKPAAVKPAAVKPAASVAVQSSVPAVVMNAPVSPTDQTKVPHYFGPYPNWAWSPQVLSNAIVSISPPTGAASTVGNPLVGRAYASDAVASPGQLGPLFDVLPNAVLPAGTLQSFQIWNQTTLGAGPYPSAGNVFHAYVLHPTGVADQYTVVYDSGLRTVPVPTNPSGEVATFPVSPTVAVDAGDVIGFYGQGIPWDFNVGTDTVSYPAPVAPVLNSTMTLGVTAGFPIFPQARTYSFAANVTSSAVSAGNPLVGRAYASDAVASPGQLGPLFDVLPNAVLPAGTLQSFQIWNQTTLGAGPYPSAGNVFHAYVLHPTGVADQYTVVYDSGLRTVPVPTNPSGEVATFPVSPTVAVDAGDVIGFYGQGIPWDFNVGTDTVSYPAPVAPVLNSTMTLGVTAGFPIFPQARTYSFGANIVPNSPTGAEAMATVDPKTGGITGYTVTSSGSGYTAPPTVTVTSPGVTPTALASATAVLGAGVVTSITVDQSGFGYTTPSVTITGANTTPASAEASGGVDDLTITNGGSGYTIQPIVHFSFPNAAYCATAVPACVTATGTATMTGGVVDGVAITDPGTGYKLAPTVDIYDGANPNLSGPAVVKATIGVGRIDVNPGGTGYSSAPTVAITDTLGGTGAGATATATVVTAGAVTSITPTAPGAGYLTPGLKKFVDTLSGLTPAGANNLGNYIPIAVPDTETYPGTDYYEIGVVQYRQKFATSLPATLQRGYVQLSTLKVGGAHIPLTNANLDPGPGFTAASTTWATTPAMLPPVGGVPAVQALGVDKPNSLGPTIVATKNRPTRILFRNLLPTGVGGDLFLPTDTSIMGSGMGPKGVTLDPTTKVPMDMATDQGLVTDGVRNPACGESPKPLDVATGKVVCFSENRATLHLHGGITPWISDGTPHQWTTPNGENTDYPQGVSVSNVPDMPDPGPGAETFFYTNQQSARLMFYHDHAWGITRLNVYAGEAAPYLITDATETKLTGANGALAGLGMETGTPLIVQDKTFVSKDVASGDLGKTTDPTWQTAKWGGEGSLWLPHVYMPAQNPGSPSGSSVFGRWMYGPWFWPPAKDAKYPPIANPYYDATCDPNVQPFCEPAQIPSTPNVSVGMEAFHDTPIVNGTAYPKTTVDPKAYRYRILNAGNDRFWDLQWYVADPTTGTLSEVALKPAEVAAAQSDPNVVPTPDLTKSPAGPSWIQIGTEGGFLPSPVVVPNQPLTWIIDPTRFDVGNVDKHSLLLAPAERADVIVDFSQYRGRTLILYNDSPAAFPARQASYDMYTGGPDFSPAGPHPTLPGYGPNTRTIMQVKVSTATAALAFDQPNTTNDRMGSLMAAFVHHSDGSGVFESGSDPIIVGQAAYNTAYGSNFVTNGYCSSVSLPAQKCDGFARIQQQGGDTFQFNTLGPLKNGAGTKLGIPLQPKGIHDEANSANFDEWGRMSANMGLEAPGATPLLQNIILYPFVNPPTENLDSTGLPSSLNVTPISSAADGTQIWKITHNGVDTHPLHFHLYNVQVLNRVTWDNIIMPPDPNEIGWKETVRVSPLEDTYVAVRPIKPTLPFGIPDSSRAFNPAMPIGAAGSAAGPNGTEAGFNNTDANGNPIAPIVNAVTNFGWEYVWHCHMLSHEEMDMMRPVTVHTARALPAAPNPVTSPAGSFTVNWTDGTPVNMALPSSWSAGSDPGTSEIGFRIERAPVSNTGVVGPYAAITTALANTTTYTDTTAVVGQRYMYKVIAFNAAGDSAGTPVAGGPVTTVPGAPTIGTTTVGIGSAVVNWTAPADAGGSAITGYSVQVVDAATSLPVGAARSAAAGTTSLKVTGLLTGTRYQFQVLATNAVGPSPYSALSNAVTVETRLSDFNRDGFTDVVARDTAGNLYLYPGNGVGGFGARVTMGVGFTTYTIATPGDVTGDGVSDIVARASNGVVWVYPGTGSSGLGARFQIATGWSAMTAITSAGDLNGDGHNDLLVRDGSNVLWLYPMTGNAVLGTRVQLATALTGYTIMGPGDFSGDGFADVLARDTAGTLWLYRGTGAGALTARTQVSTGWNTAAAMFTPGNWNGALGNDLITRESTGTGNLWLYPGNNAGGFGARTQIGFGGWNSFNYLG